MNKIVKIKGLHVIIDEEDEWIINEKNWAINRGRLVTGFRRNGVYYIFGMGRYILSKYTTIAEGMVAAYKNKNPLDNRKENLIIQTKSENVRQSRPWYRPPGESRRTGWVKGVYARRLKNGIIYEVILRVNGKLKYIGRYDKINAANRMAEWIENGQ